MAFKQNVFPASFRWDMGNIANVHQEAMRAAQASTGNRLRMRGKQIAALRRHFRHCREQGA